MKTNTFEKFYTIVETGGDCPMSVAIDDVKKFEYQAKIIRLRTDVAMYKAFRLMDENKVKEYLGKKYYRNLQKWYKRLKKNLDKNPNKPFYYNGPDAQYRFALIMKGGK